MVDFRTQLLHGIRDCLFWDKDLYLLLLCNTRNPDLVQSLSDFLQLVSLLLVRLLYDSRTYF